MTTPGFMPVRVDGPPPFAPAYGLLAAAESRATGVRFVIDLDGGQAVDWNDVSPDAGSGETMDEVLARYRSEGLIPSSAGRDRWLNGVVVWPYPTGTGEIYDERCTTTSAGTKVFGDEDDPVENPQFDPIVAYIAETCASYGIGDQAAYRQRALTALAAIESSIVARHFMSGEGLLDNGYLADSDADILNSGAATSPVNALALLENAIAATGKGGVIHASPGFAVAASDRLTLDNRTGVIRTVNGTVVVADPGYVIGADGPSGGSSATPTEEWAYATGPVDIRRSEMFVLPDQLSDALDRGPIGATSDRSNSITYRAERYYLIDWDKQLQAAVLVDRCRTTC